MSELKVMTGRAQLNLQKIKKYNFIYIVDAPGLSYKFKPSININFLTPSIPRSQFHQRFTSAFFVQKSFLQLFSS